MSQCVQLIRFICAGIILIQSDTPEQSLEILIWKRSRGRLEAGVISLKSNRDLAEFLVAFSVFKYLLFVDV